MRTTLLMLLFGSLVLAGGCDPAVGDDDAADDDSADDDTADDDSAGDDDDTGDPQADIEAIIGSQYLLDMGSAVFTEPADVGALLAQYMSDVYLVFHVTDIIEAQDLIVLRFNETAEGGEVVDASGDWSNPWMSVESADELYIADGETVFFHGLELSGRFTTSGNQLIQGSFSGPMDTRSLDPIIDPNAEEGAACQLLGSLEIACVECPNGDPYCITLAATDVVCEQL